MTNARIWSRSGCVAVAENYGNPIQELFDGRTDTGIRASAQNQTGQITFPSGTVNGNVRVYIDPMNGGGVFTYNSTSYTPQLGWNDLGNIDLTSLTFTWPDNSNIIFINAIELDGKPTRRPC